ncbi:MAG: hypothetical protein OXF25_00075 [Cyanobacteria bacterium MAG CAR3_bin_5]|nr:hypothetical protein [Cyanobacteria bacterium MAG CAR4_bin_6]MCY4172485.1 hypothetical protein [Cyanobacteria bacterium MAG CAR3_bin_5]MCY4236700.1 hypothetical protein [Cyanobacteria bacterium MAG CAR2_bin_4]MCY4331099.1 hypothetical protein [Cyanobacteria bacterium MAG CAR1_bin_15]
MTTEAGTQGCLALIACKHHLEEAMAALQGLEGGGDLQDQLLTLHAQVEHMHDQLRRQAAKRRATAQGEPRLMSASG